LVLHPKAQNAIIILGDGEMNTQWIYFPQGDLLQKAAMKNWNTSVHAIIQPNATDCPKVLNPTTQDPTNYTCGYDSSTSTADTGAIAAGKLSSPNKEATVIVGTYPDFLDECQQSIAAAQYAAQQGTRVYAVAYGSQSTGCGSGNTDAHNDVTTIALPLVPNVAFSVTGLTPCITMENIASSPTWFFSDWQVTGGSASCQSGANTMTSLNDIFAAIKASLSTARLLPTNAT
jgi:hypothetical protein